MVCKLTLLHHQLIRNYFYTGRLNLNWLYFVCFVILDLEPEKWDRVLTDEYIDKLAPLVGSQSLQFFLELDMTFQEWEQIKYRQSERELVCLNCDILEAWKQNCYKCDVKPTLRDIGRAFGNIGKHIKIIENTLFD
jgi:hypothetical protein